MRSQCSIRDVNLPLLKLYKLSFIVVGPFQVERRVYSTNLQPRVVVSILSSKFIQRNLVPAQEICELGRFDSVKVRTHTGQQFCRFLSDVRQIFVLFLVILHDFEAGLH